MLQNTHPSYFRVCNAFAGDPPVLDHTKVVLCEFEGSSVFNASLSAQPNQVMDITWDPNTQIPDELASMLTFELFNCATNKAMIYPDAASRVDGSASVTVPIEWVKAMTALHIVTTDYTQFLSNTPKRVIKFTAGVDLASTVQ